MPTARQAQEVKRSHGVKTVCLHTAKTALCGLQITPVVFDLNTVQVIVGHYEDELKRQRVKYEKRLDKIRKVL